MKYIAGLVLFLLILIAGWLTGRALGERTMFAVGVLFGVMAFIPGLMIAMSEPRISHPRPGNQGVEQISVVERTFTSLPQFEPNWRLGDENNVQILPSMRRRLEVKG